MQVNHGKSLTFLLYVRHQSQSHSDWKNVYSDWLASGFRRLLADDRWNWSQRECCTRTWQITLVCYSLHEVGRFHKVQLLVWRWTVSIFSLHHTVRFHYHLAVSWQVFTDMLLFSMQTTGNSLTLLATSKVVFGVALYTLVQFHLMTGSLRQSFANQ